MAAFWEMKSAAPASAVAVYDCGDIELATHYGVVEVDADDRLVGFEEKPSEPASTLVATAAYLYHRAHVPLVGRYLADGNPPDQPGRLVAWLYPQEPVYGYRFDGSGTTSGAPSSCSRRTTAGGNASACRSGTSTRRSARRRAAVPAARLAGGRHFLAGRTTHRPHQLSKGWSGSFWPHRNGRFGGGCGGCGGCEPMCT